MQFPIHIGLRRSRFLEGGLLAFALFAVVVWLAWPQALWIRLVGLLLLVAAMPWVWRRLRPEFPELRLERAGAISGRRADGETFVPLELLPGATIHPWLTVARLKAEDGRVHALIVAPDSTGRQEFRRLRVFLRWRAELSEPGDVA